MTCMPWGERPRVQHETVSSFWFYYPLFLFIYNYCYYYYYYYYYYYFVVVVVVVLLWKRWKEVEFLRSYVCVH